jgi:hypothetical protein
VCGGLLGQTVPRSVLARAQRERSALSCAKAEAAARLARGSRRTRVLLLAQELRRRLRAALLRYSETRASEIVRVVIFRPRAMGKRAAQIASRRARNAVRNRRTGCESQSTRVRAKKARTFRLPSSHERAPQFRSTALAPPSRRVPPARREGVLRRVFGPHAPPARRAARRGDPGALALPRRAPQPPRRADPEKRTPRCAFPRTLPSDAPGKRSRNPLVRCPATPPRRANSANALSAPPAARGEPENALRHFPEPAPGKGARVH